MADMIMHNYWATFPNREAAEACGTELEQHYACLADPVGADGLHLSVCLVVGPGNEHRAVEVVKVIERHGGTYGGDEAIGLSQ